MAFEKVAYLAEDLHKSLYLVLELSYLGKFYACYNKVLGIEQHSIWQKWTRMLKAFLKSDRLSTTVVDGKNSNPTENNLVS